MKKRILSLLCTLALMAGMVVPAHAVSGIQVQLNGKYLTFSDAAPEAVSGRTFLPFRTVFEAMGAKVDYESETSTVVAVKDGRTLRMALGSTEATVTEDGIETVIPMDVAAYAQNNRTYIPVRFAAQAFGCNVGWDAENQTVVLVDTEKLIDSAMAGHSYTLLSKLAAYGEKYNTGNWALNGKIGMDATALGSPVLTADCDVDGIISNGTSIQASIGMDMDMTGLYTLLAGMGLDVSTMSPDEMVVNMDMDLRSDMSTGKLYYLMDGMSDSIPELPVGAWLLMDLNEVLKESGLEMDFATVLKNSKSMDYTKLMSTLLSSVPVESSATSYSKLAADIQELAAAFSDENFKKVSSGYTNTFTKTVDGVAINLGLNLSTNAKGEVTGYEETFGLSLDVKSLLAGLEDQSVQDSLDQFSALGLNADTLTVGLKAAADETGVTTTQGSLALGNLFTLGLDGSVKYASTTKIPETTPPAGATVVNWSDLMAGLES